MTTETTVAPTHESGTMSHLLGVTVPAPQPTAILNIPPVDRTVMVPYGVRVPTFVVSPWIPADANPPLVFDHCSITKTVLVTFCGATRPFLSNRVNASHTFESFLTAEAPRLDVPDPPTIDELPDTARRPGPADIFAGTATITAPVNRERMRRSQVDFHELTGRLARMLNR